MKKIKKCVYCNEEFETQNNKKQYCSNSCRVSACRNGLNGNFQEKLSTENFNSEKVLELEARNEILKNENLQLRKELSLLKTNLVENEHRFKQQHQNLPKTKYHFDKKLGEMEKLLYQIEKNTQKDVWDKIIPFVPVVATALSTIFTNSKMEQNNLEAVQSLVKAQFENLNAIPKIYTNEQTLKQEKHLNL